METGNNSRGKLQRLDRSRKVEGYMYRIVVWLILKECLGKNTEISSIDQVLDSRIEILKISKFQTEGGYHQRTHRE
jgi:hypothetical protein